MRFKDTLSAPPPREASAEHLPTTPALKSTITRIGEYGLFVHTENETDGLVHHSRLPEGVTLESAQVGDTMMVAYIGVSPYGRGSLLFNGKGVNQNLD